MVSKLKTLQQNSDNLKKREFFAVSTTDGTRTPKGLAQLEVAWQKQYNNVNTPVSTYRVQDAFGKEAVVVNFDNGLQIVDDGHRVSFRATNEKAEVDRENALIAIGVAANLLYRQGGFGVKHELSTNRADSNDMTKKFEESYKNARKMVNAETIEQLTGRTL